VGPSIKESPRLPGHLRAFFDANLLNPLFAHDMSAFEVAVEQSCKRADRISWGSKGIENLETANCDNIRHPSAADVEHLFRGASCIVGLHPDQAAGAAIDFGLALNKPTAIVPCCVYRVDFPDRTLPCGKAVQSPDDLVEWLLAKDPRLQEATLPFEGRNRVVFFDPPQNRVS